MNNIKERAIAPFNPASSNLRMKDAYNLYAPVADINKVGMAGFNPTDFSVTDGIVNVKEDRLVGITEQHSLNKVDKTQKIAGISLSNDIPAENLRVALQINNLNNTSDKDKPLSDAVKDALNTKQDNLTFDDVPVPNSNNPIKSGAVQVVETTLQSKINATNSNLQETKTLVGNEDFSDIAPTVTMALKSMNEDIDSLQSGVVPRVIRGFINYDTAGGILTEELKTLLTAKVLEITGRTIPNNSDAVQVFDTMGPDKDIVYTYYYWASQVNEEVPSELNGWYLAYSALSQMIENIPSFSLNFNDTAWVLGEDDYNHIVIQSNQHNMGIDNTIDVELLKLTDGTYEPIKQFTVSGTGDVDIYTDDLFSGTLIVRTSKAYRLPNVTISQEQVDGLAEDLTALNTNKADKTQIDAVNAKISNVDNTSDADKPVSTAQQEYMNNLIPYDKVIRTQAEFEALIASSTWFDVQSVAFVGQFTLSTPDNSGVKRPANVTRIDGYNNAKITVTNFVYDSTTAKGGLWDDENTNNPRCYITDLTVDCTSTSASPSYGFRGNNNTYTNCTSTSIGYGHGFYGSNNTYTNCTGTGTSTSIGNGHGFDGDNNTYTNCTGTGTGTGTGYGYGFYGSNNTYTNCTGTGTSTSIGNGHGFRGNNNTYTNCTGTGTGTGNGYGFYGRNNRIISCTALAYLPTDNTLSDTNCVPIYNSETSTNLFMIIRDCKFPQIAKTGYQQGTIWCNIANNTTMVGSIKDNLYHSRFSDALIKGVNVVADNNSAVDITAI